MAKSGLNNYVTDTPHRIYNSAIGIGSSSEGCEGEPSLLTNLVTNE